MKRQFNGFKKDGVMKRASWILSLLLGVAGANEARAQFFSSNSVAVGPFGGSRSFVRIGPYRSFGGFYSRWYVSPYYPYPYWGDPYWGSGIYYSNPAVVIYPPAPAEVAPRQAEVEAPKGQLIFLPRKEEPEKAKPAPPLLGKEAGGFRPLEPEDRARALEPMPTEVPKPPEPRPPELLKEPPPAPMGLVSRGKQAFAAQEYGRAERLFQHATRKETQAPLGYFLLAQAQFALAKYEEAMHSIQAGLQLQADWPKSDFRLEALYGPHRGDFQEQLDHLRQLVNQKPSEPALLFVLAYELWFAGRQEEAKPIFQRTKESSSDKTGIDLFLQSR
jgi:hypothetical protein